MKRKMDELVRAYREFAESYRKFTEEVYAPFTMAQRRGVVFVNILFSLYVAVIVVLHSSTEHSARVAPFSAPLLLLVTYQGFKLFLLKHGTLRVYCSKERNKLSRKTFVVISTSLFVIYILNLFAHYPGGINPDTIDQWGQAESGNYNNWHPAIHTMVIWLITQILPMYSFFIGFQILIFSVLAGYMVTTLEAWGIRKRWIILFLVAIVSHSSTRNYMLFPFKDTALTILLLGLTVCIVNIVLSNGKWLSNWLNITAIAIIGALATVIRHNGLFFTIPLGILLIICYVKVTRKVIFAVIISTMMILGIIKVVYPLASVSYDEDQAYVETVGLPMTILSGAMANNPEALDDRAREFLRKMASDIEWKAFFELGNYNSIKYRFKTNKFLAEIPPKELLHMTLRAIKSDPKSSLLNVIELTRMVWNPFDWQWGDGPSASYNKEEAIAVGIIVERHIVAMQPIINISRILYGFINVGINMLIPTFMFSSIGLHMLLLLFFGVFSVNRNLGAKALCLFLPSVLYNLGTMLLLSGPDYRFFHFNTVITLPLIFALLAKGNISEGKE